MNIGIRDVVLDIADEVTIFARYLCINKSDINWCLTSTNNRICNPLRNDKNPSLTFKQYTNRIIMIDYANNYYRGDVFEIVGKMLNKNCKDKNDFNDICRDIMHTIRGNAFSVSINTDMDVQTSSTSNSKHTIFDFIYRNPTDFDYTLFRKWGISRKTFNAYIKVADYITINGEPLSYRYSQYDPNYIYCVNPHRYKIYFPNRSKGDNKFLNNNKCPIECIADIKQCDSLVIIKSIKDKLLIQQMLSELNINDVIIVSVSSETVRFKKDITSFINSRSKNVFTIFDNDETGIASMEYFRTEYGYTPIYFNANFSNTKDPTDAVKMYGYNTVRTHLNQIANNLKWK